MKVLNDTTTYFAVIVLVVISIWAALFYYAMLDEIYDSIDDGLDNQKGLILRKIQRDSSILQRNGFDEADYSITALTHFPANKADVYVDTAMYMQNEDDFEPVRLLRSYFTHHGKPFQLQVITSMVEEDDLSAELFSGLLWLYAGLVASLVILNNFLLKRIWKPFYALLKQARKFRLDKPSELKYTQTNIDEFNLLNDSISGLLNENINAYNRQKHFTENVSHELQTPLAISINKLEALAEKSNLDKEQSRLIGSALDNLERLTRLNKSLLLLFRIENKMFAETKPVNINEVIKSSIENFDDQFRFKSISCDLKEKGNCELLMNEDLAIIMINNLVKNAVIHNHENGEIIITVSSKSFEIKNSGKQQDQNDKDIFTRFGTANKPASNGLGLSIVKAITDLYKFKISYQYADYHIVKIDF